MYEPCLNCVNDSFVKKHHISKTEHNIVACTKCGLVQVNPRDNMLNFRDNEDASVRGSKLNRLLSMMEGDSGLKLREIMEKEFITRREYFKLREPLII